MKKFKGIIFDFNGTLFWDTYMHMEAWRDFSKMIRGTAFTDEEMQKYMFGRTNFDIIKYALQKTPDLKMVEELAEEKERLYRERCKNDKSLTKLAKGAETFLDFLKENDIPRTIATMSYKKNVDFFIETFNLEKWFDTEKIVYDDGTYPGKPHPEIYLRAAKNLNLDPADCIVVEDALSGIQSAHSAGIGKIIAITSQDGPDYYKNIQGVDEIIANFDELNKNFLQINN